VRIGYQPDFAPFTWREGGAAHGNLVDLLLRALVQIGLVPYDAFRAELARLAEAGLAQSGVDDDGATTWRRRTPAPGEAGAEA